jgi:hypothetical protein
MKEMVVEESGMRSASSGQPLVAGVPELSQFCETIKKFVDLHFGL